MKFSPKVIGLSAVLILWQLFFVVYRLELNDRYILSEVVGLHLGTYQKFLYFFHYLNEFPVASPLSPTEFSKEGAERFVQEQGATLVNDLGDGAGKIGNY